VTSRTSRLFAVLAWLAAAVCVVACTASCRSAGGASRGGMVLRLPQISEPTVWDPAAVQDGPTIEILMHVTEGLVQWSDANDLVPAIAEKWETSRDGKVYTFHLRPGVKFHNGRALTASDFVYSINRALNPKTASPVASTYLNDIAGAADVLNGRATEARGLRAPDDRTLVIEIDQPRPYFLSKLTYPTAYVVAREAVERGGGSITAQNLVGTGPFKVQEYVRGYQINLAANRDYWAGPPKLDRISRRIMIDAQSRRQMFDADEVDMVDVPMADYERDKNDRRAAPLLKIYDRASVYYFAFNEHVRPLKDRRVRRALTMAINRDRIVNEVLLGVTTRARGIVPKGVPGYDPGFPGLPYDPAAARAELAAAGFPGGVGFPSLSLSFREGYPDIRRVCEVAQQDLQANLGITVRLQQMQYGELLKQRNQETLPFYFLRWAADYLDPQDFLSVMLRTGASENRIFYSNPEFDRLCDRADVGLDAAERLKLYRQAERIAVEDAAWGPVYFQKDIELWNPKVHGVRDGLMGHLPHTQTYLQ
jgi:oligopeptide transport system substrate-binding protein